MSASLILAFVDPDDHLNDVPDFEVRDASSYLEARRAIAEALIDAGRRPLRIAVYGSRMQSWFQDLGSMPGVMVRPDGLRVHLEMKWGQPLPPGLSVSEVRALDLEDATVSPGDDIKAALIEHALGRVWAVADPSPTHLAELILAVPAVSTTPWLRDALDCRLDAWEQGHLAAAYRERRAAPAAFRHAVLSRAAAQVLGAPAPEALRAHSADAGLDAEAVRLSVRVVLGSSLRDAAVRAGMGELGPALLAYWLGKLASCSGTLAEAGATLPGVSVQEVVALVATADSPDSALTDRRLRASDLRALRDTFGGVDGSAQPLARLAARVVPEPPSDPDPAWAKTTRLESWRDWLAAYLPYRSALDRLGASPGDLAALGRQAEAFSDWFTRQYPILLRDGDDLVTSVHRTVRDLLERGERVLWIVWDNLPAHHADAVVKQFTEAGLSLSADIEWRLSLLPSVTAVSFPALLAGRLTKPGEGVGDERRTRLLKGAFPGRSIQFRNTMRDVERLATDPADLSVVHFTSYDALLHKSEHELDDDREVILALARETLTGRLAGVLRSFPIDRPVRLVVTSDHGSTRLPPEVATVVPRPDGAHTLDKVEEDEAYSSRAIRVSSGTPSSDDVCACLDVSDTGLDGPVLLARGFRSWSTLRRGGGYVHGGALPEEVLVPLIVMGREAIAVEPLGLALTIPAALAIGTPGLLQITVRNPTVASALGVRVAIEVSGGARASAVLPTALPTGAASTVDITFTPDAADVRDRQIDVWIVATATVLGREVESKAPASVPVQSALRSQAADDLFEF